MKKALKSTFLVGALLLAVGASAQSTYNSKAAFVADLPPGFYLNDFSSLTPGANLTTVTATNGSPVVSYLIEAPSSGLYVVPAPNTALGNWAALDDVLVHFTSGNVNAIGAEFFLTDIVGLRKDGTVKVNFSNGTSVELPSFAGGPYSFFGIIAPSPIASLTVAHDTQFFVNVANLYVSGMIPEPSSMALVILGGGLLALLRRK